MARYTIIYTVIAHIADQRTVIYTSDLREDADRMKDLWNRTYSTCDAFVLTTRLYLNKKRHTIKTDYAMPEYDPDLYT